MSNAEILSYYKESKEILDRAIKVSEQQKEQFEFYLVNDTPDTVEALSGLVYPIELEDIERGFSQSSTYYTGYSSISKFTGDIALNRMNSSRMKLVYSTAQFGISQNRRALIPQICEIHGYLNVTCDAYTLGITQNKVHYFSLLNNKFPIAPFTYYDNIHNNPDLSALSNYLILKPSLECAATGVKKVNKLEKICSICQNMEEQYKQRIVIQDYIDGYEISVPVLKVGNDYVSLPPVWVKFDSDILTEKTVDDVNYEFIPLPNKEIPNSINFLKLMDIAKEMASFLGASGLTRYDFRVTNDSEFFLFDLAALPVLASTGSCLKSYDRLYESDNIKHPLFKSIIGAAIINNQLAQ
jgi:hypothetical protein